MFRMDSHNSSRDSHEIDSGDHQQILSSMQNSMWGEMMLEAAEEPDSSHHDHNYSSS